MIDEKLQERVLTHAVILDTLGRLSDKFPYLRMMQIIGNAIGGDYMYYLTDAELSNALLKYERVWCNDEE